jgi:hypothetical protein
MAKALDSGHRPLDADYWCVYLAAAIGGALALPELEHARPELGRALREFQQARICTSEIRALIRQVEGRTT